MGLTNGSLRAIGVGVSIALLLVISGGAAASAISSGGIGGRPANPDPENPRTESIFVYTLDKGESKIDQVKVLNNTDEERTISLHAVDGVATNTGAYTCKQNSEERETMGVWVTLAKDTVTLAPHTSELVDFTLTMPETADVGEHNGCITFQEVKSEEEQAQGGVRVHMRQALRMVATVPGDLKRSIEITNFAIMSDAGKRTYAVNVENVGNVSADTDVRISVKTLFGSMVKLDEKSDTLGGTAPVLAGQTYQTNFTESRTFFWGGWYRVIATASYDKEITTIGAKNTGGKIVRTSEQTIFISPSLGAWLIIATLLAATVGVCVYLFVRSRGKANRNTKWERYEVHLDDTIDSVAEDYGVSWKKLAAANELKAPYTLTEGQKLLVPPKAKAKKSPQKR